MTYPLIAGSGTQDVDHYNDSNLVSDTFGGASSNNETWSFYYEEPPTAQDAPVTEDIVGPPVTSTASVTYISTVADEAGDIKSFTDANGNTTTADYSDENGYNLHELCWASPPGLGTGGTNITGPTIGSGTCPAASGETAGTEFYTYNANGDPLTVTDPKGNTTTSTYDSATGELTDSQDAMGTTTHFGYDNQGDRIRTKQPQKVGVNEVTTSQYNLDDQILCSLPPDGQSGATSLPGRFGERSELLRDELRLWLGRLPEPSRFRPAAVRCSPRPSATTTMGTRRTNPRRSASPRPTSTLTAVPASSQSQQSPAASRAVRALYRRHHHQYFLDSGAPASVTDPDGNTTSYHYTDLRFPTQATKSITPSGVQTFQVRDPLGNLCNTGPVAASGSCTAIAGDTADVYDGNGALLSSTDPSGQTTTYAYADPWVPTKSTSMSLAGGEGLTSGTYTTQYGYDADGNQNLVKDPEGRSTTISYDADNRKQTTTATTDGAYSTNVYDLAGDRTSMVDNANASSPAMYTFDQAGNLLSATNDNGTTTTYGYNSANQVTCLSYPVVSGPAASCLNAQSSSNPVIEYAYSSTTDLLASSQDWLSPSNTVTYSNYNALGELGLITYPASTGVSLQYNYDPAGNLTKAKYLGSTLPALTGSDVVTPNVDNKIAKVTTPASLGGLSPTSTNTYDPTTTGSPDRPIPPRRAPAHRPGSSSTSTTPTARSLRPPLTAVQRSPTPTTPAPLSSQRSTTGTSLRLAK